MLKFISAILVSLLLSLSLNAQVGAQTSTTKPASTKGPVFRANKEQISQVQRMLKIPESGKVDTATRVAVMQYQSGNGLRATGTLNRATLEKMGIPLTDLQKTIPISASSLPKSPNERAARGPVFRANKEQITAAQRMMKQRGIFSGAESGRLDDSTRAALKTYQERNGLKVTGTLNAPTLQKMGIGLTDKQRESSSGGSQ
jgi:peptidoglycan hydrolase-like protein with peptidoglycan-binding domain